VHSPLPPFPTRRSSDLINFGYAGFTAVGAYTAALGTFHYGVSPWAGLLTGGLATAFIGLVTGVISLRLRGLYVALLTFFVGEARSEEHTSELQSRENLV